MTFRNIISQVLEVSHARGNTLCALTKVQGKWQSATWSELASQIVRLAEGLMHQGVKAGDRVALLANTGLSWTISDCAILACGAITVPIYCSLPPDRIGYILRDARVSLAIIEDEQIFELFERARAAVHLTTEIPYIRVQDGQGSGTTMAQLMAGATATGAASVKAMVERIQAHTPASIVYTSGTTGVLKGCLLTHGAILAEVQAARTVFPFGPQDRGFACLPLAHVFGRLMQFYQLLYGTEVAYAESLERIAENYLEVRPTYACVVPRMLEKIHERALSHVATMSPWKQRVAAWALHVGNERGSRLRKHRPLTARLRLQYWLADQIFFRRLRERLGGKMRTFICGGSKLKEDVAKFLHAADILVLEGYGLTETFAAATVNRIDDFHFGTVGKPLPGISVKLAADGEILIKGPTVFTEYINKPEETEAAFDGERWMKTGDLGEYSRDGFLRIIGRKKEMIVTAGGKNIAPVLVESLLGRSPFIEQIMVVGDSRKFLAALIVPHAGAIRAALAQSGKVLDAGVPLSQSPVARELIAADLERQSDALARYETIKRFAILDHDFSIAAGELTPTLKFRREFITNKYADLIESLYRA